MTEKRKKILAFMKDKAYKPLLLDELKVVLDVPKEDRRVFETLLDELIEEGKIVKTKKGRFGLPEKMNLITGTIRASERGFAFLLPDDETLTDVFIPADFINGAMNNDKVMVKILRSQFLDKKSEGEVSKILKRANSQVVGVLEKNKNFAFVVPDNSRLTGDIFIAKEDCNGAKTGDKVVVEITKWPSSRRNAQGKVLEILGAQGDVGVDIKAIIKAYSLKEDFPKEVIKEAETISDKVSLRGRTKRLDLRDLCMVTIDGEDAKDLDDAVSIQKNDIGYRLGVHIADVSHYVKENSFLDKEALKRGTSVYLVDRVIPMLPQKLSNGICSLNPHVDRFAMTVFMDIDENGNVVNHEFYESVIRTNERMTYDDVYKILEENDENLKKRYNSVQATFFDMKKLALILKKRREQRGAIDFDFKEAKVKLDEFGKPVEINTRELTIANRIIEEFMLVCNETVSEHFYWANVPFLYRVHEEPDSEKIDHFIQFAYNLGHVVKGVNKIHPKALQQVLEKLRGSKEERILSTVMLRSMKKARYTSENLSHFGLAAKYYSHFTSPIRRYPDLMIHRIMKEHLRGRFTKKRLELLAENLPSVALNCSEKEREAEEAERQTVDLKKVEYMKKYEGETFEGIISNVTNFGMFIELENTVEGLLRLSSMHDDYYIYDDKHHSLIGERTAEKFKIGDSIKVLVARVDLKDKQIEFVLDK